MPFWQFLRNWLIGWIGHALLVQPSISAHKKWPKMVVSASTNQVWTKITIRSYAWSFAIQIQIQAVYEDCLPHSTKENQISFLKKGLNFEFQTWKLYNFEPHKRAVFVNCVGVKAASRRKVKHFSPCPSLADRMPRMPHLYNILEQLALSACCLLCWSSLNWFMCRLGRATHAKYTWFLPQTNQEGIECTISKENLSTLLF